MTCAWVEEDAEFFELLDWALARKLAWMKRSGVANDFMNTAEYRDFLRALWQRPKMAGKLTMMVLRIGGVPIAVKIGCIDGTRLEGFITTYDSAWSAYSPGQIILADCLAWCHANGLYYDFRIGDEAYKRDWANGSHDATTFAIPVSPHGQLLAQIDLTLERLRIERDRLRQRIPATWRAAIKDTASRFVPAAICREA